MAWQTLSSRAVYQNPWIRVREDEVTKPDGSRGIYGVVEVRQPAVFVVPVTDDGEVVLVRLFRYTIGRDSIEIPAGGSDGEAPLDAARRELREETGLEAGRWDALGPVTSLDGVCDAPGFVFLARELRPAPADADEMAERVEEGIAEVLAVPWSELMAMIARGEIRDAETLAPLMLAAVHLGKVS
ncbi:MAG: NUDIX hydrolase [Nocardioides sp.]|uniref:NUDIX domain-containing protein n=1 Tax=Nocardioides sp. TaxID=35761 RepID=UPI0039E4F4FF